MAAEEGKARLIHVTTVPFSLWTFMWGQIRFMTRRGFDIHAVSAPGELLDRLAVRDEVPTHAVPMAAKITPFADLASLARLWRLFRRLKPQIVHSHTPKGGLLGSMAAFLARTPVRIYHIRGFPFMTATGWKRRLLRLTEKWSCRFANQVLCISPSLRDVAIREGICPAEKIRIVAHGSGNGVDAKGRFNAARRRSGERERMREELGIPLDAPVLGFVGRVVRDKGLIELAEAWQTLRDEFPSLHMVVLGPFEEKDPLPAETVRRLTEDPRIHLPGMAPDTSKYYPAFDLCVLPTYREGFGTVLLEAGAMGLPVVATRITGCVDAVVDGVTGTLVPPRDAPALTAALRNYLCDPLLRQRHGRAGRERALRDFQHEVVWEALHREYLRLLERHGLPLPEPAEAPQRKAA